ncbi:MAG: flagellar FlbD family protein [Bacillota bacterium]|nr:flagellar FlbD family protein [Bacillota bacterium]
MIKLTRLNGKEFYVNCDLIEFIESTPDTVLSLTTGKKIIVVESIDELIEKIVKYRTETGILPNSNRIYRGEV